MNTPEDYLMDEYRSSVRQRLFDWFKAHFETPDTNTPYDLQGGEFLYRWGGPYNARDELYKQFGEDTEEELIEEVSDELRLISEQWDKKPTSEQLAPRAVISEYIARFRSSCACVREELEGKGNDSFMSSILFAHVITSLEAYLSDAFLTCIQNETCFRAFVETHKPFKEKTLNLTEIFKRRDALRVEVTDWIQKFVFHRLGDVQRMYQLTLGVGFPSGIEELKAAVTKRHDIIHRNCMDKDGNYISISKKEVEELISLVETFTEELDARVNKRMKLMNKASQA